MLKDANQFIRENKAAWNCNYIKITENIIN